MEEQLVPMELGDGWGQPKGWRLPRGWERYALSIGLPGLCLLSIIWLRLRGVSEGGLADLELALLALAGAGGLLLQPVRTTLPQRSSQLSLLASHAGNAVSMTDVDGRIEWVNEAFTTLTGYTPAEAIGKMATVLLEGPETDRTLSAELCRSKQSGLARSAEIVHYTREGRKYWAALDAHPVHDESGKLTHFITVESDVTERKKAECELWRRAALSQAVAEAARRIIQEDDFWAACDRALEPIGKILKAERIRMIRDDRTGSEIGLDIAVPIGGKPWAQIRIDSGRTRGEMETAGLRLLADIIGGIAVLKGIAAQKPEQLRQAA